MSLMNSDRPVSFYFHIPPHLTFQSDTIIKLFMEQMMEKLSPDVDYQNQIGHRHKMLMLLDNLAAFGKIDIFEKKVMRSCLSTREY